MCVYARHLSFLSSYANTTVFLFFSFFYFQLQLHVLGENLTHQISGCRKRSKKTKYQAMGADAGYGDE